MGLDLPDVTPQFVDDAAGYVGDRADDVVDGVASLGGFVAKTAEGAWDLASDPLEEIYAEARRGVIWLREQAAEIADFAVHPVGDSESLRTSAGAWAAVARALDSEGQSLKGAAPGLARAWKGPNSDAYLDGVSAASSSMAEVEAAAKEVQQLLERGADTIDDLNKQVHLLVVETLAWIGVSVVVGLITGGGGLVVGGARVALAVKKVKTLVATARSALVALRVAQAVRLSAIGYKLRKTAELSRLGTQALAGADKAVRASKRVSAAKATLGATKLGRGATRTRKALSPFSTKQRRLSFAANSVGGAIGTSLMKDPRDWTAEDIARIVAGGYINAAAGKRLSELLTEKGKMGPGSAAVIQNALFGAGISASTQAAFNEGRVDWTKVGTGAAMGGIGGGVGRGSVRRRLDREGLSETRKEAINFAGGAVAIPAGKRLADRNKKLRKDLAAAGDGLDVRNVSNPDSPGLPSAPILHTIRPGETLSSISGDRLDDPEVWRRIREANPGLTDPDLIRPGDQVVIPSDLGFHVAD